MHDLTHENLPQPQQNDLLTGAPAIAAYLGLTPRQVRHLVEVKAIPVFRLHPSKKAPLVSSRSVLQRWITEKAEAAARSVAMVAEHR